MLFGSLFGLFSNDMAIDLGTSTILIYVKGKGIVLMEPSVVAINKNTYEILAAGTDAKNMIGRTPANIVAIRPLRDGVIADFRVAEKMLKHFILKIHNYNKLARPRIVIAIPSGITEVETRAVKDSATQAGAREVYLIEEPMAAAIGAGLPVEEASGSLIVDSGGGTSEIAVISLGGIVCSKSIRVGGDEIDEAIIHYIKTKYNVLIGERTAEEIKIKIGSAYPLISELDMEVKGRDLLTGLPRTLNITSEEIRDAISEPVSLIVNALKETISVTPPELASDIIEKGITLAGGTSQLRGFDEHLYSKTGLPVKVAEEPQTCVVKGAGSLFEGGLKSLKKFTL